MSQTELSNAAQEPVIAASSRTSIWRRPGISLWLLTCLFTALGLVLTILLFQIYTARPFVVPIFARLFFVEDWQALQLMAAVSVLAIVGIRYPLDKVITEVPLWLMRNLIAVSVLTGMLLAIGSHTVYQQHPFSMDEYAVLFQSQIFAKGHLSGSFPPTLIDRLIHPQLQNYFIMTNHQTGAVASAYWPGLALLMTPFTFVGMPWLINAVIGSFTVWTCARFAQALGSSEQVAGTAVLLLLASPVFWADNISLYAMPAILLFNMLFAWGLWTRTLRGALLAGVAGSIALSMANPVPHILFAICWLAWFAASTRSPKLIGAVILAYLPLSLLLCLGWPLYRLSMFHEVSAGQSAASNSSFSHYLQSLSSILSLPSVISLQSRLAATIKLWGWGVPGLMVLAVWGYRQGNQGYRLMAWAFGVTFLGYLLVPYDQGHGWGYRYVHYAFVALPMLAAIALHGPGETEARRQLQRLAGALVLGSVLMMLPLRLWQVHGVIAYDTAQLPAIPQQVQKSITFLRTDRGFYPQDLIQNDPFVLNNHVIMLSYGDDQDARLIQSLFPGSHLIGKTPGATLWQVP
ncbi:hypothetical protein [Silvimonas amylolytica]|uniref:Dolichyl-phosphate-mannose-protein mannosyltransferase n=1 Tax=Silvimonas amylolytica TaxID=449663 RepID=A0ABQ2PIX2_9NEIS|nr:hypothetical protein [Silvimonas amylolytica]GGP25534.1 hypothetical protein GCM10010971_13530 [Silvimonas amylolytica]